MALQVIDETNLNNQEKIDTFTGWLELLQVFNAKGGWMMDICCVNGTNHPEVTRHC